MRPGRTALAVLLGLSVLLSAVAPGIVAADVRGNPDLSVTAADNRVTPGEETSFTVTVLNTGVITEGSARNPSAEQRVMTARGTTVELRAGDAPVSVESGAVGLGSLSDGAAVPATVRLSVDENADPGTYSVPVDVSYTYTSEISGNDSEDHETRTVERTLEVDLVVESAPRFEVVNATTTAPVGGSGTAAVRVRNVGQEAARDATVALQSPDAGLSFGGAPSAETYAGRWAPGETRLFEYEVRAASGTERRQVSLRGTVTYEREDGTPGEGRFSTGVTPRPEQSFAVESVSASVSPGSNGQVTLALTNTANRTLRDTAVTVRSPNSVLTFGGAPTAQAYVGRWAPDETRRIPVEARLADGAPVRDYGIEVSVNYTGENDTEGTASFLTGVRPALEQSFALTDAGGTLRVGEEGEVTATLVNEGPSVAENAVLVLEDPGRNVDATETEYAVGDLGPGESASVRYDVAVSSAATDGPRQFRFHLEYEDAAGDSQQSDPTYLRTEVAPEQPVFAVRADNASVQAGSTTTVTVDVTNAGDEPVSAVSAKLFASAPLSASDDEAYVDSLAPGETAAVTFQVSASGDANAKTYPVSVDFQYDDADGDTQVSDTYRLPIEVRESQGRGILSLVPIGGGLLALLLGAGFVLRR